MTRRRKAWYWLRWKRRTIARIIGRVLLGSRGDWGKFKLEEPKPIDPQELEARDRELAKRLAPHIFRELVHIDARGKWKWKRP